MPEVERNLAAHVQAFFAVLGGVDRKAFALQAGSQGLTQGGFVFNQQNAHGDSFSRAASGPGAFRLVVQVVGGACRVTGPVFVQLVNHRWSS